jgi:hypothetical protein
MSLANAEWLLSWRENAMEEFVLWLLLLSFGAIKCMAGNT